MSVKNGTFQLVGDQTTKVPTTRNKIVSSPSSDPKSGEFQKIGTEEGMSRSAIYSPSANPPSGTWTKVGTEINMSRSPINDAWGSAYRTPMSKESAESDNNAAHRARGKNNKKKHSY